MPKPKQTISVVDAIALALKASRDTEAADDQALRAKVTRIVDRSPRP